MKQMFIIVKETYVRHVKSWSFLFMVLSPFLLLGFSIAIGSFSAMSRNAASSLTVVSSNSDLKAALSASSNEYHFDYDTIEEAQKAVDEGEIEGFLVLDMDQSHIKAQYQGKESMDMFVKESLMETLDAVQADLNRKQANLSEEQEAVLNQTISYNEVIETNTELAQVVQTGMVFVLSFIMYFLLLIYLTTTAQEIANEKGTKIMEVVFSSIRSSDYFYGRMLGLTLVVFTHIGVYVIGAFLAYLVASQFPLVQFIMQDYGDLFHLLVQPPTFYAILFLLFGLLFYLVLSAVCGALVTRVEDVNKALQPLSLFIMAGFLLSITFGMNGSHPLITVGSYIPFLSPFFMPIRLIHGDASYLGGIISLLILVVSIAVSVWYIGQIYASLILQTDDASLWKNLKRAMTTR